MAHHTKNINETIGVSESRKRGLSKRKRESVGIAEKPDYPRYLYESPVTVTESHSRNVSYSRSFNRDIGITETLLKRPGKRIGEDIGISEVLGRRFTKRFFETVLIRDTIKRNANAVLFDLVIRNDVLDIDDLNTLADSPPVGYTPFQNFYPGDYEYEEALIGIRIRSFDTTGRPGILGLKLNVDVPDITERGTSVIGPADISGKTVPFSKTFTIAPEVFPQWSSGPTAAVAELISVTESEFVVILRDISSPATLVEGTITWAAIGR